jgi:hypothetical protein
MGYELHIVRSEQWFDSKDEPITLEDWRAYVAGDQEMIMEGTAEEPIQGGGSIAYSNPGLAVWARYSGHGRNGNKAWLDHREGRISVKNPDREITLKMLKIAAALDARVVGDDGEDYADAQVFQRSFPE